RALLPLDVGVRDELVVSLARRHLGGGREDRFGQARALDQPAGQRDTGHRAVLLVRRQAGTGQITARYALDHDHLETFAPDGPAGPLRWDVGAGDDVVRRDVREL